MPKGTILFAENTWENRKKWLLLLTEEDYEVLQTGDLSSALRLLRVCPPQLVIAPMNLPDGDAFSFVGHLRGIREFAEIPFLCLSDNLSTERQMLLQKAGVTGFFDQTESPSRFLELVKEQIQLHLPGFQEGPQGITGNLAKLSIHDLLLQLAQRHGSGKISIDGNREMSIYLNEGQVVHARHGITVGKKALFRCLHIAEATYHFQRSIPAIQPTIGESSLSELIREATLSNQKLMTGMHKWPRPDDRIAFHHPPASQDQTPLVKAALDLAQRHSLVEPFVDHLNIPDADCYELLSRLVEKDLIRIRHRTKTTALLVDSSSDLSLRDLTHHKISVYPLALQQGDQTFMNRSTLVKQLLSLPEKNWQELKICPINANSYLQVFSSLFQDHELLTLVPSDGFLPNAEHLLTIHQAMLQKGLEGQKLTASQTPLFVSKSISVGFGLLVLAAAEKSQDNLPPEQLELYLNQLEKHVHTFWVERNQSDRLLSRTVTDTLMRWHHPQMEKLRKLEKQETVPEALASCIKERYLSKYNLKLGIASTDTEALTALQQQLEQLFPYATLHVFDLTPANLIQLGKQITMVGMLQQP